MDSKTLSLVWLWDHVNCNTGQQPYLSHHATASQRTVNVVDDLVSDPAIVLQDVEVLGADSGGNLLRDREQLRKGVVRDVCELLAVVLGDDELGVLLSILGVLSYV